MNKKILLGIMTIGLVSMLAGTGLLTYFSDTETSVENVFTAGTIDISIDPTAGQNVVTVEGALDLKPCETGYTTTTITNVGPNPANIYKHVTNVLNEENGITDAEQKYYAANPASEGWLISNWIHYDMLVWKAIEYSFEGTSITYSFYKEYGIDVGITVESTGCEITWTFDFPIDADLGNGNMGYGLVISTNGVNPDFQVHNNDGTDGTYPWGTHLYSEYDNGWHTGDTNTPVSDLDWIECTGERKHDDNAAGIFTVTIDKCKLTGTIYWAAHFGAGGFYDYGGLSKYPDAWVPWSGDSTTLVGATIKTQGTTIIEDEGFYLTGTRGRGGVASKWIPLANLEPGECICVLQSYHLDETVENWGQSDQVTFDIEYLAQQIGSPPPEPILEPAGA